jgi:hypothetical protein
VEQPEIETLVGDLETAVDRLRSLYEQYFMGFEKMEPQVPRKDVDRKIHVLRKEHFRNTALRFRFQMILQRYNTYQTHWQRILREIENGTYKRHVLRAERRFADSPVARRRTSIPPPPLATALPQPLAQALPQPGAALAGDLAAELAELDRDFEATPVAPPVRPRPGPPPAPQAIPVGRAPALQRPATPLKARPPLPLPARVQPQPPAAPAPPRPAQGLPEERVRQIYSQYIDAKRRQNESTAAITYEGVAKSLRDSSSKLEQKHGKKVDFEVAIKDGKTILKPVLK